MKEGGWVINEGGRVGCGWVGKIRRGGWVRRDRDKGWCILLSLLLLVHGSEISQPGAKV